MSGSMDAPVHTAVPSTAAGTDRVTAYMLTPRPVAKPVSAWDRPIMLVPRCSAGTCAGTFPSCADPVPAPCASLTYGQWYVNMARMAHDMDKRHNIPVHRADVPHDVPDVYQPQWNVPVELTERPDWTLLRPPVHPDDVIGQRFAVAVLPLRLLALAVLFATRSWVTFLACTGTLALLLSLYQSR